MKKNEKNLFLNICSYESDNAALLKELLADNAGPNVLGLLFFNRMQGIAYGNLKNKNLISEVNREFRNALKSAYEDNLQKNESYFRCINYLNDILKDKKEKYAMLKGAYLCSLYPKGYRTSNDVDLLVRQEDVTDIGNALRFAGFVQGHIRNDAFIPASRAEIISSKMMRGETVPYIKEMNLPGMKYLEVDINFSLGYKNETGLSVDSIISDSEEITIEYLTVKIPSPTDFIIYLCCHLYKEATALPWIEMRRDMTLYKYCDIYMLLGKMPNYETDRMFMRAETLGLTKECCFAVLQTAALFDVQNKYAVCKASKFLSDREFMNTVFDPKNNKQLVYTNRSIRGRFFSENRKNLLKEKTNEKA